MTNEFCDQFYLMLNFKLSYSINAYYFKPYTEPCVGGTLGKESLWGEVHIGGLMWKEGRNT